MGLADLCEALEDLSEEEKKAETLPIVVQQIYVLTRQGEYEDAEKLGESVAISEQVMPTVYFQGSSG